MGIGGLTIVKIALFQVFGDYRTLEDHVEHHKHWNCRINGLFRDKWDLMGCWS